VRLGRWKSVLTACRPIKIDVERTIRPVGLAASLALAASNPALADEGGVPFWLSGQFGSLAAAPQVPGWSVGIITYIDSVGASGNVAAAREVTIGRLNPNVNVNLNLNLTARPDLVLLAPDYVFATPVLGGQVDVGMAAGAGWSPADLNGTLTVMLGPLTATRQGEISDSRWGFSDLYPHTSLRWNNGVNSWMVYAQGDIPVGTYDSSRLANFGIGHGAIGGGVGYTYFDSAAGPEFSVVTGLSYNFVNPSTDYQNGIDWNLDWGASQFVTKTVQVGAVGYFYQQLTADRGAAPFLGENLSRIAGIGPQIGFIFPAGQLQGYLNFKAYGEFAAENRAAGWNAWVTLAFSPKAEPPMTKRPMLTK
jgi:hypothetical protein